MASSSSKLQQALAQRRGQLRRVPSDEIHEVRDATGGGGDGCDVILEQETSANTTTSGAVWLGAASVLRVPGKLATLGISRVLTVASEVDQAALLPKGVTGKHVLLLDKPDANLASVLPECVAFIHEARTAGQSVLVHCVYGVSRSASVVCAYLIRHQHLDLADALALVRQRRSCARPNSGFIQQLEAWQKQCRTEQRGSSGRHTRSSTSRRERDTAAVGQQDE